MRNLSNLYVDGVVGIGTTSPSSILDIRGASAYFHIGNTSDSRYVDIGHWASGRIQIEAGNGDLYLKTQTSNYLALGTANVERLRIDSAGSVGIGTTSPSGKLTVVGDGTEYSNIVLRHSTNQEHLIYASTNFQHNLIGSSTPTWIWGQQGSTERMRLNNTGLGIGTTSPGNKLHVNGDVIRVVNSTFAGIESHNTNGTWESYIGTESGGGGNRYNSASSQHTFYNNSSAVMRINGSGNVGIGTTTPNHKVDIYSNENVPLRIHRPSNANLDSSGAWGIGFSTRGDANNSTTDTRAGIFSYYNGNLFLAAANTSIVADPDTYARLTVLNTGNVGIGTTAPSQKLHVVGNTYSTGITYGDSHSAFTEFRIRNNENNVLRRNGSTLQLNSTDDLVFSNTASFVEAMRIKSSGNVGIGTTSPSAPLAFGKSVYGAFDSENFFRIKFEDVGGTHNDVGIGQTASGSLGFNVTNGGSFIFNNGTGGESMRIVSGNVGIGTSSPAAKLDVNGFAIFNADINVQDAIAIYNYAPSNGNSASSGLTFRGQGQTGGVTRTAYWRWQIEPDSAYGNSGFSVAKNYDGSGYIEYIRINSSGNVGIGTTSPRGALHVQSSSTKILLSNTDYNNSTSTGSGTIITTGATSGNTYSMIYGFKSGNTAYADLVVPGGNVGIGTTIPTEKLDVEGNVRIGVGFQLRFNNANVGAYRDSNDLRLAGYNGIQFMSSATSMTAQTERMRIVGSTGNVLIGTTTDNGSKLQVNGDASINGLTLGRGPGNYADNTVFGDQAFYANTNGRYNVAIGQYALYPNAGGDSNTAVGAFALNTAEGVNGNTALGESAGYNLWNSGDNNTAIGRNALQSGYDYANNTAVGAYALYSSDASNNTALGYYAGFSNSAGTGNVFIGYQAGQSETGSNKLYISNSSTSNLIYGDFSTKYLGFGTTSPGAFAHIKYSSASVAGLLIENDGVGFNAGSLTLRSGTSGGMNMSVTSGGGMYWYSLSNSSNALTLSSSNNLIINGAVDNGKKLQVNGDVFIKGSGSASSTKIFEVQNSNGTSIMDFRGDAYAFFGCGQGGGAASGFIFRYNDTSHVQFTGYNYGNGSGSYKPILLDTDLVGRGQGIYVNFGGTGYANPAPLSTTEFAVRGRTSDSSQNVMQLRDSNNTDKFVVRNDGAIFTDGSQGWTGTVAIPNNPPGSQNLEFKNGILVNVF
jgi:hypothetical protein